MKFLAIKAALKKAGVETNDQKINHQEPLQPVCLGTKASVPSPVHLGPRKVKRTPERVVGGDILWKPVDKTAALVIARAPWWAHPPPPSKPEPPPAKPKRERKKRMPTESSREAGATDIFQPGDAKVRSQVINGETYINYNDAINEVIKEINRTPQALTPLARAAVDARNTLHEAAEGLGTIMDDFQAKVKVALGDIRNSRMAMLSEMTQMIGPLKEVRQFFIGPNYDQEIARLSEFVGLCERLKALKDSGFLDSVADTMLRISEPNPKP